MQNRWCLDYFCLFCLCWLALPCTQAIAEISGEEIHFAVAQAPLMLDPRYALDAASERVNQLVYESLVTIDAQFKPIPGLADWQQISPTHFRFTLRQPGSRFHHGRRLMAQDVAASYKSLAGLTSSAVRQEYANIKKIQASGTDGIDVHLHSADSLFLYRMTLGILPADLLRAGHDFNQHPVGSGPLQVVARQPLRLKRTTDQQTIGIDEVRDPVVRALKLLRGEADLLQGDMPPELVRHLQSRADIRVQFAKGNNFSYIGLNLRDPLLRQLPVRQALQHAIDREAIIRHVLPAGSRLATHILPPEHWANPVLPDTAGRKSQVEYDPLLAKKLLQEAGITLPLKLVFKTSTDAQRVRLATILQAQMAPAGIQLEIKSQDWGTFFADVQSGHFQLFGLTWVGIKTPDIYRKAFHSGSVPPAGANRGFYQDAETDLAIEAEQWAKVSERVASTLPYIPLWYEGQFAAYGKEISGYAITADGSWADLRCIRRAPILPTPNQN